jgi:hypothetical protein
MTRRNWLLLLGSGICAALLSACNRHAVQEPAPGPAPATLAQASPVPVAPQVPRPPLPVAVPSAPAQPADPLVEPVAQATTPLPRENAPQPPAPPTPATNPDAAPPVVVKPTAQVTAARPVEEAPLIVALRCLLDNRPNDALNALQRYDQPTQDLLKCVLPLAVYVTERNIDRQSPQDMSTVVDEIQRLLVPLSTRAALAIDQMCFCSQIDRFGVYMPLPKDPVFHPGDPVQVYVELRNFSSERQDQFYVTHLTSSVEIRDYNKRVVRTLDIPENRIRPDRSRTQRHDYFNNYQFCIPNLPQGEYTLWIKVVDTGHQPPRQAERSLDFRVTTMPMHTAGR